MTLTPGRYAEESRRCEIDDRFSPIRVCVVETIEYELTINPTEPRWKWLQDLSRSSWVAELDNMAAGDDSPVEHAIKETCCAGAWREVTHP